MEQKIRTAKTLQLRFDATITGADAKKWTVKGTLILGEDNKLRVEAEGKLFGEESKFTVVSDGADMKSFGYTKTPGRPKQDKNETEKSPKAIGAYFRGALPRDGVFLCLLNMDRRSKRGQDLFKAADFNGAMEANSLQTVTCCRGKFKAIEARVMEEKVASDHRPVLVVLEWAGK